MPYDMSPAEVQAYLDQAQSPAERLAALQAMGAPVAQPQFPSEVAPPPAPVAYLGAGGAGGAPPIDQASGGFAGAPNAVPTPAPQPAAPALGGVPQSAPAAPEVPGTGTGIRQPAAALGGAQAPQRGVGLGQLHAAMAESVGAPPPGQPELRNPVGDIVKPFTPDELGVSREIDAERFANIGDTAEAQDYARQATARAQSAALDKQEEADAEVQRRAMERQETLRQGEQRYREMADQIAAEPIDSDRLWNSKSTGEKMLGSIAVFLGAFGQSYAGLPNLAWEKMQREIDRDIEAQKANKAMMQNRLAAEGSLLDMARQRFGDAATQDAAMRESAYRRVSAELDRFKEFAKTPERAAQLDALKLEADAAIAGAEQQRRQALDAAVIQQRQIDARRAAAAAGPTQQQKLDALLKRRKTQVGIKRAEGELSGESSGVGLSENQAGQAALDLAAKESALRRLEDLQAQLEKSDKLSSPFARDSIKQQAVDTWAILEGKRQMTKEEQEGGHKALFAGASGLSTMKSYIEGQKREVERQRRKLNSLPVNKKGKDAAAD